MQFAKRRWNIKLLAVSKGVKAMMVIILTLDVLYAALIFLFANRAKDKTSKTGFTAMGVLMLLNIFLIIRS